MIEFLFQTIVAIFGFIFKITIGLVISIFTADYKFKPVVITLFIASIVTAIILLTYTPESASSIPALEEIEGTGSVYEKDARLISYIISTVDLDLSVKKLLKKYSIEDAPECTGDRLLLNTIKNNRGQEIVLEAIVDLSGESISKAKLKGYNVMFRNDLDRMGRGFYTEMGFAEVHSALSNIMNTSDSPDESAGKYPVYVFWDMCCNTFSYTVGDKYWDEADYMGVSK